MISDIRTQIRLFKTAILWRRPSQWLKYMDFKQETHIWYDIEATEMRMCDVRVKRSCSQFIYVTAHIVVFIPITHFSILCAIWYRTTHSWMRHAITKRQEVNSMDYMGERVDTFRSFDVDLVIKCNEQTNSGDTPIQRGRKSFFFFVYFGMWR